MRRIATTIAVCAAVGAAGTAVAVACPPGQGPGQGDPTSTTDTTGTTSSSSVRDYSGTVTSINAPAHKFRLRTDSGKQVTIRVKGSTDFGDGASSIRSLNKGDDADVTARRTRHGLVATDVSCPNGGDDETTTTPVAP
jgi:hypothetical protein